MLVSFANKTNFTPWMFNGMSFIYNTMLMGSCCELQKITINEDETHATFNFTRRRSTQFYFAANKLILLDPKGSATVS